MPFPGPRTPRRCFFLSDSDQYDALLACTGSRFDVGASYLFLVVFLLFLALLLTLLVEVHYWNLMLLGILVNGLHVRITDLSKCGGRRNLELPLPA